LFNRFNEDLLDDLQMEGIENSGRELIKWIIKSNLFVFELDRLGEWFRYHHLFQSLLRTQLKNQVTNKELIQYHSKASLWFEQKGFLEESLDHALAANDISRASDIVKNHRMDLISSDNYFVLERLQRKIPESIIENDPELLVVEEYLAWNNYEMMKIVEISDKWASQFEKKYKNSILAAENGFFNGFKYLFQGDSGSHIEGIKKSLKIIPESAHGARQIVELHFLMYSQSVGEYDSSKEWFSKSLKRIDEYPYSRKNLLYVGILIANLDEADLVEMEKNYLDAIKTGRESKLNNRGNIIMLAANLMMRQGRWEESIEYFKEGLDLKYVFFTRSVVDIMTGHIVVNALMGKYEKCHDLMRDFKKYVDNTGEYLTTYLWSCQIRYQLIRGNKQAIRELLPAYQSVVFDVIIWMDFPDITYANALVFEGSEKNLKTAKSELERLAQLFSAEQNWIHLLEVHAVQALCFEKQGDTEKAKEALSKSIDLAEEGSVTGFYIELGNDLLQLVNKMPEDFKNKRFITKIMDGIKQLEILRRNLPPEPEESKITDKKKGDLITLTQKEMDVLRLVADGFRNKEIADKLFNSEETIKKHIYNIFQKLNVKNRLSLVSKAREEGILTE